MSSKTVYLFDWQILRRIWYVYAKDWKKLAKKNYYLKKKGKKPENGFMLVLAENDGYTTYSVAVPTGLLLSKLNETRLIQL